MEDLRIGVLGLGIRASLGRHAHRPGQGSRVVAVCDTDRRALERGAEKLGFEEGWQAEGVLATTERRDLLAAGLDAVLVLTPDHTHAELAVELLEAGTPVYLEKPLAISVEDCDRILLAARRTGTRLYVGHNMRHMPVVLLLRELIDRGEIGRVEAVWCRHFVGHGGDFYFKDWHADRRLSGGLLLQKGAHDLDVIHWLTGGYTRRVSAMGGLKVYGSITDRRDNRDRQMWDWFSEDNWPPTAQRELNPVVDVEDLSMMLMELDNGVHASYQQCHFTPDYWRNYTVIGTEGRLENFGDGPGGVVRLWNRRTGYRPDGDASFAIPEGEGGHAGADTAIMAEFLRYVRDGGETLTSPVAARQAVAAGVTATRSLREGGTPLEVPPLPDGLT
ncbi:Gfo/Idh/MocA family protein [Phaeacidiphilus oryzae]|uniref:Gfo/Idh/MocA family protein n=1 Tax=Phaeacidiphilus oryzae TaxID=348818 RepID=UPI00055D42A4|nr:Gfo/Idh/MocA family oxidoreductase [Phaeacidiphilus oryzae]